MPSTEQCRGCGNEWPFGYLDDNQLCSACQVEEFQKMQEEAGRDYDFIHHGGGEVGLTDG
ncbi:hypothetical protein LCGC14_0428660 [marine sediment metagenome]|uniref:GATA-type domain-containing protein n=1 Tax=marine sediment metagenome TaxID=412755 RepID=A0A0F9VAX0_9ZZZZ